MIAYPQNPKIVVSRETKEELENLRLGEGETYNSIIVRLLKSFKKNERLEVEYANKLRKK
ncbi:hypothetical protein HOE04_02055 [archaeon]|jgi:hypothetical protein|nr:hypothetical protein [archaeon]